MESTFPEWAQEYKKHHNVTLKQQGSSIYVYKKTSKREKGKKNPVTYEKYLGILVETGLIPPKKMLICTNGMVWAEYGWSRAMELLCPDSWRKAAGIGAEELLHACIIKSSPDSYFRSKYTDGFSDKQIETKVKTQTISLYRRLKTECGIDHKDLEILKRLHILSDQNGHLILTRITDEMNSVLEKLKIDLRMVNENEINIKNII